MAKDIKNIITLFFITLLFTYTYFNVSYLYAPPNGYFIIDKIHVNFWLIYSGILLFILLLILKTFDFSKELQILLTYVMLYLCSIRAYSTLHFIGFFGTDSASFVGLTEFWLLHDRIDLGKVYYGDNPGFFILGKIFVTITKIEILTYTKFIGILLITLVYLIFKLNVIYYIRLKYLENCNHQRLFNLLIPLVIVLTYFILAVPFTVNFQYAPQTFSLVLLLYLFTNIHVLLAGKKDIRRLLIMIILYIGVQISHPFMFIFSISTVTVLFLIKIIFKSKTLLSINIVRNLDLKKFLVIMIMISLVHIIYQTVVLKRKIIEILDILFDIFVFKIPTKYIERLFVPVFPYFEKSYFYIAVIHSITWVIVASTLALFILKALLCKCSKDFELALIVGSLIASLPFTFILLLQELMPRAGQIILFGSLLLAIRGIVNINQGHRIRISYYAVKILMVTLVISSFLSLIRYSWYAQPPHLSPVDLILSDIFKYYMDYVGYDSNRRLLLWSSLNFYHNFKHYGLYPKTYSPIMLLSSSLNVNSVSNFDILCSNMLQFELIKYFGRPLNLNELYLEHNVILSISNNI
ncbi:MAG: hypothetical protein QXW71_06915, partial [Thermoplasmata archaeon]